METTTYTTVQYTDANGHERTKKTNKFGHQTNISVIKNWISGWWKVGRTFELEVKDSEGKFVDFDDGYIEDFEPFNASESTQATALTSVQVKLRIINMDNNPEDSLEKIAQSVSIRKSSTTKYQEPQGSTSVVEQPSSDVLCAALPNHFSSLSAPNLITVDQQKTGMEFTENVNDIQRDQYTTDKTNAESQKTTGYYVNIQGKKDNLNEKDKHRAVLPKIKISSSTIASNERSKSSVLVFLVDEVCENGKRKFYHHKEHKFIDDDDAKMNQAISSVDNHASTGTHTKEKSQHRPAVLPLTNEMFSEGGADMELKVRVIPGTKTHSKQGRLMFCELTNDRFNNITYETIRLACLLVKNGNLLWDHLVFSNAMIFSKSINDIGDTEIKDANGTLCEKIPVRIFKRKKSSNQSGNVQKRPLKGKKMQQSAEQTRILNLEADQTQVASVPLQNQVEYAMSATATQCQRSNLPNAYIQHQNQDMYSTFGATEQFQNPSFGNKHTQYANLVRYPAHVIGSQYQGPDFENNHMQYQNQAECSMPVNEKHFDRSNFRNEHVQCQYPTGYPMLITDTQYQDLNLRNDHMQYQNQTGYSMSITGEQSGAPNLRNEHGQYPNQVDCSLPITRVQPQHLNLLNGYVPPQYTASSYSTMENSSSPQDMLLPMTTQNISAGVFQNQSTTTAMNSYGNGIERTIDERETFQPVMTSSHLVTTNDSHFRNFLPHDRQERSSEATLSLPTFNSLSTASNMHVSSEEQSVMNDDDEDFPDYE